MDLPPMEINASPHQIEQRTKTSSKLQIPPSGVHRYRVRGVSHGRLPRSQLASVVPDPSKTTVMLTRDRLLSKPTPWSHSTSFCSQR